MSQSYNQVILDSHQQGIDTEPTDAEEVDPEAVHEIISHLEAKLAYYRELEHELTGDSV